MFWSADRSIGVLQADAETCASEDRDAFDLAALPCSGWLKRGPDGYEELLLAEGPRRLALATRGASMVAGPVRLRYRLAGLVEAEARLPGLTRLLTLMQHGRLLAAPHEPPRRAGRWAMALRTFDARRAGASQREIAVALFGVARVETDWYGRDDLRKTVARLIRTGDRLVTEWRDLLVGR